MALGILVSRLMAEAGLDYDELAPLPRVATHGGPQRLDPDTFRMVLRMGLEACAKCEGCGRVFRRYRSQRVCVRCRKPRGGQRITTAGGDEQ